MVVFSKLDISVENRNKIIKIQDLISTINTKKTILLDEKKFCESCKQIFNISKLSRFNICNRCYKLSLKRIKN